MSDWSGAWGTVAAGGVRHAIVYVAEHDRWYTLCQTAGRWSFRQRERPVTYLEWDDPRKAELVPCGLCLDKLRLVTSWWMDQFRDAREARERLTGIS